MSDRSTGWGRLAIALLVTILSVPAVVLLIAFTQGVTAVPFVVVICVTPLFLFHYCIWGAPFLIADVSKIRMRTGQTRLPDSSPPAISGTIAE